MIDEMVNWKQVGGEENTWKERRVENTMSSVTKVSKLSMVTCGLLNREGGVVEQITGSAHDGSFDSNN